MISIHIPTSVCINLIWTLHITPTTERRNREDRRLWAKRSLPSQVTSRVRTRSLLFPTRMMGVCGWVSLSRSRSWAVRWKLRLSVTENTRTHTSHSNVDRSLGEHRIPKFKRAYCQNSEQRLSANAWHSVELTIRPCSQVCGYLKKCVYFLLLVGKTSHWNKKKRYNL